MDRSADEWTVWMDKKMLCMVWLERLVDRQIGGWMARWIDQQIDGEICKRTWKEGKWIDRKKG